MISQPEKPDAVELLRRIERNTAPSWLALVTQGLLRGAGFTLGSVLIIALSGWLLAVAGVIPGLGDITRSLHRAVQTQTGS
jgi:hypothetical protein